MSAGHRLPRMQPRVGLVAATVLMLTTTSGSRVAAAEVKVGDAAPEFVKAKAADGKPFTLRPLRGGWVVFSFGARWCEACADELPQWDAIAPAYPGVTFVAVNIDNSSSTGKKFMDKLKLKHLVRVFMPEEQTTTVDTYEPNPNPTTYVIDPKGIVRHVQAGYYGKKDVSKLKAFLAKATAPKAK